MNAPLQIAIPENVEVHIHFGSQDRFLDPAVIPVPAAPRRNLLRLGAWSVLMLGLGFFARGAGTQSAALSLPDPLAAELALPPGVSALSPGANPLPPGLIYQPPVAGPAPARLPLALAPRPPIRVVPSSGAPPQIVAPVANGAARNPFGLE